jgi:hypothetical protein
MTKGRPGFVIQEGYRHEETIINPFLELRAFLQIIE